MLEVKVKGPAIKLNGEWKFKGETALVEEAEYKANEKYLELLSGEVKQDKKEDTTKTPASKSNNEEDEKRLATLREKAKDLGIKGAHNMKEETLIAKIKEFEEAGETGSDDSGENGEDGKKGQDSGEGQPQE